MTKKYKKTKTKIEHIKNKKVLMDLYHKFLTTTDIKDNKRYYKKY